jgi:predicted DNA-binding transcriptional regulator AlpA
MSSQFVTLGELGAVLGVSRSTAARMAEQEGFPDPVNVGGRRAWLRADIEAWSKANPPRPPGRPPKRED